MAIGPEHGTIGPELVQEAAKEAVRGARLIVAGFAFDPHVSEEARRCGKLVALPSRVHSDLQMGDAWLQKTGAGNLFMIFGEPDVRIKQAEDSKFVVEVKGVDIYDPTTGQISSDTTDDIACRFTDTDFNGESFFVRQAHFTGGQGTLRATQGRHPFSSSAQSLSPVVYPHGSLTPVSAPSIMPMPRCPSFPNSRLCAKCWSVAWSAGEWKTSS